MEQRKNFLALCLLDLLEDENEMVINNILDKYQVDPSFVQMERGISPLHFSCGMSNISMAIRVVTRFLKSAADVNVRTSESITPLHIAAMYGRETIVDMLLKHGADMDINDDVGKTPVLYAIEECHFEVVKLLRDHIFLQKYHKKYGTNIENIECDSDRKRPNVREKKVPQIEEPTATPKDRCFDETDNFLPNDNVSTPNRLHPNYDVTSPDHMNITHRRHKVVARLMSEETNMKCTMENINGNTPATLEIRDKFSKEIYTPNKIHYNYDVTSPYYINITHRRHRPQPSYPVEGQSPNDGHENEKPDDHIDITNGCDSIVDEPINIFSLTQDNLRQLTTRYPSVECTRNSLIRRWCNKVEHPNFNSIQIWKQYESMEEAIDSYSPPEDSGCTVTSLRRTKQHNDDGQDEDDEDLFVSLNNCLDEEHLPLPCAVEEPLKEMAIEEATQRNNQCEDKHEVDIQSKDESSEQDLYEDCLVQIEEAYVHTDDENGLVFYEKRLRDNFQEAPINCKRVSKETHNDANANETMKTESTQRTATADYETDALRVELKQLGLTAGPITKSTKRLYIKRLVKYKRQLRTPPELENRRPIIAMKFSVELYQTMRSVQSFERIVNYMEYVPKAMLYFCNIQNQPVREGHLKKSFIYLLIDPRLSSNLPAESVFLDSFDVWKSFLLSIFYVGKGKTTRPYSHLYDAMKIHSRNICAHGDGNNAYTNNKNAATGTKFTISETSKIVGANSVEGKKIHRILDIWSSGCGVVCLHIFHNILPIEAYTREAAIIDALSLRHLTNIKRGNYYGPAKSWAMKEKKLLGVALLFKAMQIYLVEGESQLSPQDLI